MNKDNLEKLEAAYGRAVMQLKVAQAQMQKAEQAYLEELNKERKED